MIANKEGQPGQSEASSDQLLMFLKSIVCLENRIDNSVMSYCVVWEFVYDQITH